MPPPSTHRLDVPGARLYVEVQGSGPVLMLIGHPVGSSGFAAIAPLLANDYTVVTYDPRGLDCSPIDDPDQDAEPNMLADDVGRVLEAVADQPAHVFGSSGGAVTGLALVTRHPERVHTLIAHEPPLALLLPDAEGARAGVQEIYDTYRENGIGAAWQRFSTFAPSRVVVGGGATSEGELAHRAAAALAERLGTPLVTFPGGHGGFASDPADFVATLRRALT